MENLQDGERRKHNRTPCFMAVDYVSFGCAYTDFIRNMSHGGVFIDTRELFINGETVSLTFKPPNYQQPIKITGQVVRTSPNGIGVKCDVGQGREPEENKAMMRMKRSEVVGRRKHKRYLARNGAFAILNKPSSIMGQIRDINTKGLSFSYTVDEQVIPKSSELDILFLDTGFYLSKLPFKTVSDLWISKKNRRSGVFFGQLREKQLSRLKFFIQNHTIAKK